MRILAGLGIVSLKIAGMIISIISKIGSVFAGPFLVFVISCAVYCLVTSNWKSLVILVAIGGGTAMLFVVTGLLLGLIDVAKSRMHRTLKMR